MTPERFAKLKYHLSRRQPDLTVIAENVHKTHNIAAIQRTADAVGVFEMHAVSDGGEFRRHHMISGGSRKWVEVTLHDDIDHAVSSLRSDGFSVLAAHRGEAASDYREIDYTQKTALLLGAELDGVTSRALDLVDRHVMVPMEGMVASLNVSVAAALILYEARRQREAAGMYDQCRLPEERYARTLFEWAYPDLAMRCRQKGRPYPPLGDEGELLANPLNVP